MSKFTAKQKEIVARKLGYDGPMQGFDEFLQSSPALQMKYGMVADKYMAKGGFIRRYAEGGAVSDPTRRQYNLSQEASDYLNRQNAATNKPWEYDTNTRKFTRQGDNAPETMSYDDVMRNTREERVQSELSRSESGRPTLDPQERQNLDSYVKQALPNLLEDARRTGDYPAITDFLVKNNFTEADINRVFGSNGLGADFNARLNSGDINAPVISRQGVFAYNKNLGRVMNNRSSSVVTESNTPDYITQAYGLIGTGPQRSENAQAPAWLQYHRSQAVGPDDMSRARDTAIEFANVYGREITPDELDDFMGTSRSNIVQNLGLDPKDRANYIKSIAPARDETIKKILRDVETGRGGSLTQSDMKSLGMGQFDNLVLSPQQALEALNSGNPTGYVQQFARQQEVERSVPYKTDVYGEVAGIKIMASKNDPWAKSFGAIPLTNANSLSQIVLRYGLNDEELGQLAEVVNSYGDDQYANRINQLRTGMLPPEGWQHAAFQNKTAAEHFNVAGTPEADTYVYQGAYRPLVAQASGLNQLGYKPLTGLGTGPVKSRLTNEQEKINEYNRLRQSGLTNTQVRYAVNKAYGNQTDADWAYLVSKSRFPKYSTGGAVTPNLVTEQQKIDEYNRMRESGISDTRIREMYSSSPLYGAQTDADWNYLVSKSRFASPTSTAATPTSTATTTQTRTTTTPTSVTSGTQPSTTPTSTATQAPTTMTTSTQPTTSGASTGAKQFNLNIDIKTATAQQKTAEYNRLRSEGFTDAEIRAGVDTATGTKQTDADWSALQGLASTAGTTYPTATPATAYGPTGVPIAGATQQIQAQQTSTDGLKLDATNPAYQLGVAPTADVKTAATAEQATAGKVAAGETYSASTALTDVQDQMNKLLAEKGTLSEGSKAEAAVGTLSEGALAKSPDPATAASVTAPEALKQTDEMLAKAATVADVGGAPSASAQTTEQTFKADAATFTGETPEAKAATDYTLGAAGVSKMAPTKVEDAAKAGAAEQATAATVAQPTDVTAAKFTGATPQATAATQYNLSAVQSATLTPTAVQAAAKAGVIPEALVQQTTAQSTAVGQERQVASQELVDVSKQALQIDQPVQAVAAVANKLNQDAIAIAQQGNFSQALATAQEGRVEAASTVQGQLGNLMQQFNDGTPAWAAGAMRAANAAMAARGIGGSSMAGAAIVQAAMEAATPIAAADAQVFAQMQLTNLNNRQQVALANASAAQNLELANLNARQQAALQNSANAFSLQSQNLSNEQSVVLANAQLRAAAQEKNLDVKTSVALTNAARFAEVNNLNLSNRQQAMLQRSAENIQIDIANLNTRQQTALANLQVRAAITGQELSNEQQMAMLESTQSFEAAQFNANAKQQAFITDFQARAALEGQVLSNQQQTNLFNVSSVLDERKINLTNEQQTLLFNATNKLQVDITNASNLQQTALANLQVRAALQGQELSNEQQMAVLQSTQNFESAQIDATNQQQAFIAEFNAEAALKGQVLSNQQQTSLFNVSSQLQERGLKFNAEQQVNMLNTTNAMQVELANLSNKQQTALANAQIDAALKGQELSNKQQVNITNAARVAEIANVNFTAEQQNALANAQFVQQINLQDMTNKQATVLANAATTASMDIANLNAKQQAAVQNAQAFLAMDMANLDNAQKTSLFKAQELAQVALSDAAAENAAKQFNATNKQQADQFSASLSTQVSQFNAAQTNAMTQFNTGQENAMEQFNSQMKSQREQFNVTNRTVIDQANAQLLAQVSTANTAAVNAANFANAQSMNNMTMAQYNNEVQLYRDQVKMVYDSYERGEDRAASMATALLQADVQREGIDASTSASYGRLIGALLGTGTGERAVNTFVDWIGGLFG